MLAGLLLTISFSSTGCKKDEKDASDTPAVSVKFDDNSWNADVFSALYSTSYEQTTIYASRSGTNDHLQIIFKGNTTGTYNITSKYEDASCTFTNVALGSYTSSLADVPGGSIVVTKYDQTTKTISGTFYFEGDNLNYVAKSFTEGKFTNVKLEIN